MGKNLRTWDIPSGARGKGGVAGLLKLGQRSSSFAVTHLLFSGSCNHTFWESGYLHVICMTPVLACLYLPFMPIIRKVPMGQEDLFWV